MQFEYDPKKSESSKRKHGINFNEAQALWDDPEYLEIPYTTSDELRLLVIGKIGGKHWSGIITYREDRIRIISVRRSRSEEVVLYES